ncbi:MAG: lysylphosphatidylglycerol synthase transmembrane domain-containing protein [Candidatus Omnitrophica bacterium]|nr:lysylphosphatidylglycerol synthase transmembrane domain-containing protein [Candidatus Omnitrophota bacterium]
MELVKKIVLIILRISISIGVLIFLFTKVDIHSIAAVLSKMNKPYVFLAFIVYFLTYLFAFYRWKAIIDGVKIPLKSRQIFLSFAGGMFFNLFLPTSIGGDFVRSIDLSVHTKKPKEVVATVILDRLSGYVGLVILAVGAILFGWRIVQDSLVLFSLGFIILGLLVILFVFFNPFLYGKINRFLRSDNAGKVRETITGVHQQIHYFRNQKALIVENILISVIIQSIAPVVYFILAGALGIKVSLLPFFIFLPIISAITLLPITLGGLGLREASAMFFFAKIGILRDQAFAMSLVTFFFMAIISGCLGIIYFLTAKTK